MEKANIEIGKIVGAVGIKGYLRVKIFLSEIKNIKKIGLIFFEKNKFFFELKLIREHKGNAIVSIKEIKDRNSAESLIGNRLFIKRSQLPSLKSNEYYLRDFIGFIVRKRDGMKLGFIKDTKNFGADDLIEVCKENKKTFFLPINKENIDMIDMKNKVIIANPIKGIVVLL